MMESLIYFSAFGYFTFHPSILLLLFTDFHATKASVDGALTKSDLNPDIYVFSSERWFQLNSVFSYVQECYYFHCGAIWNLPVGIAISSAFVSCVAELSHTARVIHTTKHYISSRRNFTYLRTQELTFVHSYLRGRLCQVWVQIQAWKFRKHVSHKLLNMRQYECISCASYFMVTSVPNSAMGK